MSRLAIHLNDAGITISDGERITYREPGFAWLGDNDLRTGNEVQRACRRRDHRGQRKVEHLEPRQTEVL